MRDTEDFFLTKSWLELSAWKQQAVWQRLFQALFLTGTNTASFSRGPEKTLLTTSYPSLSLILLLPHSATYWPYPPPHLLHAVLLPSGETSWWKSQEGVFLSSSGVEAEDPSSWPQENWSYLWIYMANVLHISQEHRFCRQTCCGTIFKILWETKYQGVVIPLLAKLQSDQESPTLPWECTIALWDCLAVSAKATYTHTLRCSNSTPEYILTGNEPIHPLKDMQ